MTAVTVADINGDGNLDLVTPGSVLLGNGDGNFQATRNFSSGGSAVSVAVGDFRGAGILDLAVVNYDPPGNVSVLLGNGDSSFQAAPSYPVGSRLDSVAVGDFNGDGIPDLVVANDGSNVH